jgi:uncharacterized cupredoxin-like copper-binding protein
MKILATLAATTIMVSGCGGGDSNSAATAGRVADPADADRTVQIAALDLLKFDPDSIQVDAGETVTFEITNSGSLEHEFVIGADGGHDHGSHASNGVHLAPGDTGELTWTFDSAGEVEFACHIDSHDQRGMVGVIEVT